MSDVAARRMLNLFKTRTSELSQVQETPRTVFSCSGLLFTALFPFLLLSFSLSLSLFPFCFFCFVNGGRFPALPFSPGVCCRDQLAHSQTEAGDSSILYFLFFFGHRDSAAFPFFGFSSSLFLFPS